MTSHHLLCVETTTILAPHYLPSAVAIILTSHDLPYAGTNILAPIYYSGPHILAPHYLPCVGTSIPAPYHLLYFLCWDYHAGPHYLTWVETTLLAPNHLFCVGIIIVASHYIPYLGTSMLQLHLPCWHCITYPVLGLTYWHPIIYPVLCQPC